MHFHRFWAPGLLLALLAATPAQAQRFVCMESNHGNWCMELLWAEAPANVANFLRYVNDGEFNNSLIHRNLPGLAIQGGALTWDSQTSPMYYVYRPELGFVNHENSRPNARGTVAMLPLLDGPDTAADQWFINTRDNVEFDDPPAERFTVFANIVRGMDVVDAINALPILDASAYMGSVYFPAVFFDALPTTATTAANFPSRDQLVLISRAWATDLLPGTTAAPYHCSTPLPGETLTEVCGTAVSFPLLVKGQGFFEVTLQVVSGVPPITLALQPGTLKPLATPPAAYGSYDPDTGLITVPSARTGLAVYKDLVLKQTAAGSQQFTLQDFKR